MNNFVRGAAIALAWIAAPVIAQPGAQTDMRGHWSGALDTPAGQLNMEVDLDKSGNGWIGSITIPAQGISGLPLDTITFADGKGSFRIKGPPGDPTFTGNLSPDGKSLEGTFTQGPAALSLKLTRTGDAKVETVKASPPVSAEFLGSWEGTINVGPGLRVSLTISNTKAGAEAVMVSLDQGNAEIPVSAITQNGTKLTIQAKAIGGGFDGEINKDGTELNGTWTQVGNTVEMQLKRVVKPQ
jgi:hypothetical protein